MVSENDFPRVSSDFCNYRIHYKCYAWRRGWQRIGSIYTTRFSWSINLPHHENLHVVRKTFIVNPSHLMKSVQLVQRVIQVWNWKQLRKQLRVSCSKTHWLPLEDTSNALLYFLTTCTALCHRGTLKCLLMSVIIDKRVSRKPQHRRKLRLNHLL